MMYTLSSYIMYNDAVQESGYHNFESCIPGINFAYVYIHSYMGLPHIAILSHTNKYILHSYMLARFFILLEQIP